MVNDARQVSDVDSYYYRLRRAKKPSDSSNILEIEFTRSSARTPGERRPTMSVELTCTNGRIASFLKTGDISRATERSPEYALFENINAVSNSLPAIDCRSSHWHLINSMRVNFDTLLDVERLKALLYLYDVPAKHDKHQESIGAKKIESILNVSSERIRKLWRGCVYPGLKITIETHSGNFTSDGELFLFFGMLNRVLNIFVSFNTIIVLQVTDINSGRSYHWGEDLGNKKAL